MEVLWLAILFYSVGLGLVLYFRPKLMFLANGTWKEFGYQRDARHTLFPFWLFAIVWAFVSYAGAAATSALIGGGDMAAATATAAWMSSNAMPYGDDSEMSDYPDEGTMSDFVMEATPVSNMVEMPMRRSRGRPRKVTIGASQPREGYYVLDSSVAPDEGIRRYIYFGPNPPANE